MYWTLELAYRLEDAPWPATKDELIDYATRSGAPLEVVENLEELDDDGEIYESIEDIWPDYPTKDDFSEEKSGFVWTKFITFTEVCEYYRNLCFLISNISSMGRPKRLYPLGRYRLLYHCYRK